jgi:hypothetical protein
MGYDMLPWDNMESKKQLLQQAVDEAWRLVLYHEPNRPVATVSKDDRGRFVLTAVTH